MIYWFFYKSTLTVNLTVSFAIGFLGIIWGGTFMAFPVSFTTVGLFFALLYKETVCPNEYYFYYNRGISKIKLISICLLVNIVVSAPLILIILHYVSPA